MVVRPPLLYGTKSWSVKKTQVQRMLVAQIRMLHWMCGHSSLDLIRNVVIGKKVKATSIEDKMSKVRL